MNRRLDPDLAWLDKVDEILSKPRDVTDHWLACRLPERIHENDRTRYHIGGTCEGCKMMARAADRAGLMDPVFLKVVLDGVDPLVYPLQ